jgi:hypothetical protein
MEKEVCSVTFAFIDIPPSQTPEGHRQRVAVRRQIEKCVNDPRFINEFAQHYSGFTDFLKRYDLNASDVQQFLDMDMRYFSGKIKRR